MVPAGTTERTLRRRRGQTEGVVEFPIRKHGADVWIGARDPLARQAKRLETCQTGQMHKAGMREHWASKRTFAATVKRLRSRRAAVRAMQQVENPAILLARVSDLARLACANGGRLSPLPPR